MGMVNANNNPKKWLVAAWPGIGHAAMISAGYLIHKLQAKPIAELPAGGFFDINAVEVRAGVVQKPRLPRGVLHHWKSALGDELYLFLGEAQPDRGGYTYAHQLLDMATKLGANRVVTFASVATNIHPSQTPSVHGIATQPDLLSDLTEAGIDTLDQGQIGGLNGVLLGAAAARGLPGLCILGEIPSYAPGLVHPKSAAAIIEGFGRLTGVKVDMAELAQHFTRAEEATLELMEQIRREAEERGETPPELPEEFEPDDETEADEPEAQIESLDYATREGIERLFEASRKDRARASELKAELDKLGIFDQYEDRFLDLFKPKAG